MSDTPRTDAKTAECWAGNAMLVLPDFARGLERENAALRAIVDDAIKLIEHANPNAWANGNTHPDGLGPDEGEVMASHYFNSLLDARAAIDAARKERKP
jgi:hypothetical protein